MTEIGAFIHYLKKIVFILTRDLPVIHYLSNYACSGFKVGASYALFQRHYNSFMIHI